jgi:hypothetical protein
MYDKHKTMIKVIVLSVQEPFLRVKMKGMKKKKIT